MVEGLFGQFRGGETDGSMGWILFAGCCCCCCSRACNAAGLVFAKAGRLSEEKINKIKLPNLVFSQAGPMLETSREAYKNHATQCERPLR